MLVTEIQQCRVGGAEEFFQPNDLDRLDSCDEHGNEGRRRNLPYSIDGPPLRTYPSSGSKTQS
ncbi:hypothetical protein C7U60_04805 [Mesorhizobium plurifarium]|nr:hypothetical protein C7U60_04805 [Mesorhizobium plurifarium]